MLGQTPEIEARWMDDTGAVQAEMLTPTPPEPFPADAISFSPHGGSGGDTGVIQHRVYTYAVSAQPPPLQLCMY